MNLLVDTHIFIWCDNGSPLLPAFIAGLLLNSDNQLFLSVASIWEMQIKHQLGKLPLRTPLHEIISHQQDVNNFQILPVNPAHVFALSNLTLHHRDPFDRLLIAQSQVEKLKLVTVDRVFDKYGIEVLPR